MTPTRIRVSWAGAARFVLAALVATGAPVAADAQPTLATFQARFDRALAVFNSAQQPEAIPQLSQLIDDLRGTPNRTSEMTTLLARALQYRAQARENVGQTADADADLRLIRDVAPAFRLTDPGLSTALVNRFNALVGDRRPAPPAAPARAQPAATVQTRNPILLSGGYQYLFYSDCSNCSLPTGGYVDVAGPLWRMLSWAGEFSASHGSCCDSENLNIVSFGGGVRAQRFGITRGAPYGQILFGRMRESVTFFSQSWGAVQLSGGMDVWLTGRWHLRAGAGYTRLFKDGQSTNQSRVIVGVTAPLR